MLRLVNLVNGIFDIKLPMILELQVREKYIISHLPARHSSHEKDFHDGQTAHIWRQRSNATEQSPHGENLSIQHMWTLHFVFIFLPAFL